MSRGPPQGPAKYNIPQVVKMKRWLFVGVAASATLVALVMGNHQRRPQLSAGVSQVETERVVSPVASAPGVDVSPEPEKTLEDAAACYKANDYDKTIALLDRLLADCKDSEIRQKALNLRGYAYL